MVLEYSGTELKTEIPLNTNLILIVFSRPFSYSLISHAKKSAEQRQKNPVSTTISYATTKQLLSFNISLRKLHGKTSYV